MSISTVNEPASIDQPDGRSILPMGAFHSKPLKQNKICLSTQEKVYEETPQFTQQAGMTLLKTVHGILH